jgi:hypothetical protein
MITKLTRELEPADVVDIFGTRRTIASVTPTHVPDLLRVLYEPASSFAAHGGCADADDAWQVDAPSKLDLAVQRAQELADLWPSGVPNTGYAIAEFGKLLDLFRAAR